MAKIVAEIGCNHKGDFSIAAEMIKVAAQYCKADYVKFQKRNNKELLSIAEYNAPHPNAIFSYGPTYGEHRDFLEFSVDEHRELRKICDDWKIGYSTSVWDVTSALEIASFKPDFIKVPSACNLNFAMLEVLCKEYDGGIQLSFGMTTHEESEQIVSFFEKHKAAERLVLYACTSGYPVPFEDICLLEIKRLQETFGPRVQSIGFSGHHLGIAADVAALTLGAEWIERHFTLDRTWKGTDHAASLEPEGMRRLCRDIRAVSKALTYKPKQILDIEETQRKKLKRGI